MANKIDSKITGYKVKTDDKPALNPIVELLERDEMLTGGTVKIKPALSEHAYYITVNFIEINGIKRPFEVFIKTKDIENQELILSQAIMYSSIFRKGSDYQFIIDEMKLIHDPKGSYRGKINNQRYTFVSLTHHIAEAIDYFIKSQLIAG